jgi:hypothetical protein
MSNMGAAEPGLRQRRTYGCVLGALSALACSSGAPRSDGNEQPDDMRAGARTEPNGNVTGSTVSPGPPPALVISELPELLPSTTPDSITLELLSEVDHVGVRAFLQDVEENDLEGCQSAEIYRVGKNAVDWPVGDTFTLPLSYDRVLAPGVYSQHVQVYLNGHDLDRTGRESQTHLFEVSEGSLRPLTIQEYGDIVDPVTYGADGVPYRLGESAPYADESAPPAPPPCPEPEPYSDEVTPEAALSSVSFDSWQNVQTVQPLRWLPPKTWASARHTLEFSARSAAGQRLRFEVSAPFPSELESEFEVSLASTLDPDGNSRSSQGWLELDERDGTSWLSIAGRIRVQPRADGQVSVELFDIVLDKSRLATQPQVTRTVATGVIVGSRIVDSPRYP